MGDAFFVLISSVAIFLLLSLLYLIWLCQIVIFMQWKMPMKPPINWHEKHKIIWSPNYYITSHFPFFWLTTKNNIFKWGLSISNVKNPKRKSIKYLLNILNQWWEKGLKTTPFVDNPLKEKKKTKSKEKWIQNAEAVKYLFICFKIVYINSRWWKKYIYKIKYQKMRLTPRCRELNKNEL